MDGTMTSTEISPATTGDPGTENAAEYHDILLTTPEGKRAYIDFSDDGVVKYGGDMPVSEAAKFFFDEVGKNFLEARRAA